MNSIIAVTIIVIAFILGIIFGKLSDDAKYDGRMVVGDNEYFVAITIPPEEIEEKEKIVLKVFKK